jgi:hypothetical protein
MLAFSGSPVDGKAPVAGWNEVTGKDPAHPAGPVTRYAG